MVMESRLNQRPGIASCYSDYFEDDNGKQRVVEQKGTPLGSCVVFDRHAFEASGGYDESLSFQEDYDLWQRLTTSGLRAAGWVAHRVEHVKLPLWYYRKHEDQMSNAWNERQKVRHQIKEKKGSADKVLAVIPARGNSKGIARKNMRLLDGVPLVARAIRRVKQCDRDMLLVVSTEDKEIADLAEREGADVIARPEELADDDVSCIEVVKHAMEHMDAKGWRADIVISIQVTEPFTQATALAEGIDLVKQGATSAVSVAEITTTHPYRAFHLTEENGLVPYFEGKAEKYLQRQDRPKAYAFTGGFYVRRRELLEQWDGKGYALGIACRAVSLEPPVIDINNIQDLWLAESIISHGRDI